jgi:hypothetical protein
MGQTNCDLVIYIYVIKEFIMPIVNCVHPFVSVHFIRKKNSI